MKNDKMQLTVCDKVPEKFTLNARACGTSIKVGADELTNIKQTYKRQDRTACSGCF